MRLVILVAVLALVPVAATAQSAFTPIPAREYREYFNQPNPVKGEALVGVAIVPDPQAQRSNVLHVFFGEPYAGGLVVETATADGSFRGSGEFAGTVERAGWAPLLLGTDGKSRPADPAALAVAARGKAPNEFRVVHWGDEPAAEDDLVVRLYVNGRRGDMSVQAAGQRFRCGRLEGQRLLRFDMVCDIPWSSIPADGVVTLVRRDGFNVLPQQVRIAR